MTGSTVTKAAANGGVTYRADDGVSAPVNRFLEALARRDVDGALSAVSERVRVRVYPLRLQELGRDSLRGVLAEMVCAFPDLLITVKRVIVTGEVVTAQLKMEGTQAAHYAGAINQEKHLDIDQAWRFTVEGGEIAAVEAYWCQQQLYRRLAVKRFDQIAIA
jgi:ketosteroid isomerase-like protein